MRLAYLCADRGIPVSGNKGASLHVRAVAQALCERSHDVTVVAVRESRPVPGFTPRVLSVPFERTLKDLRRSIDVDGKSALSSELYSLLLNARCQEILADIDREEPLEAIYERYSLWSTGGAQFARRRKIPWLVEVNAPLVHEQKTYRELRLHEVAEGIERFVFSQADAIFVPSQPLREYVFARVGRRKRVYVLPNGADTELFSRPQPLPHGCSRHLEGRFVVVFVGSLKPWHGVQVLLQAFEEFAAEEPRAHLLVLGQGPMLPQVESLAERLGPERITVAGEVPHAQIPGWLRLATVATAPYPKLDNFYFSPLKIMEYMAAGLPVVASGIGQIRQLVAHEKTGLLVPPGDSAALRDTLHTLAADRQLCHELGKNARARAVGHHSWARVADSVDRVLVRLAEKAKQRRDTDSGLGEVFLSAGGAR